jgi:hypothetical protein
MMPSGQNTSADRHQKETMTNWMMAAEHTEPSRGGTAIDRLARGTQDYPVRPRAVEPEEGAM